MLSRDGLHLSLHGTDVVACQLEKAIVDCLNSSTISTRERSQSSTQPLPRIVEGPRRYSDVAATPVSPPTPAPVTTRSPPASAPVTTRSPPASAPVTTRSQPASAPVTTRSPPATYNDNNARQPHDSVFTSLFSATSIITTYDIPLGLLDPPVGQDTKHVELAFDVTDLPITTFQLTVFVLLLFVFTNGLTNVLEGILWFICACVAPFFFFPELYEIKNKRKIKSKFAQTTFPYKKTDDSVVRHMVKTLTKIKLKRRRLVTRGMTMMKKYCRKCHATENAITSTWKQIQSNMKYIPRAHRKIHASAPILNDLKKMIKYLREANQVNIDIYATVYDKAVRLVDERSAMESRLYVRGAKKRFVDETNYFHRVFSILQTRYNTYISSPTVQKLLND